MTHVYMIGKSAPCTIISYTRHVRFRLSLFRRRIVDRRGFRTRFIGKKNLSIAVSALYIGIMQFLSGGRIALNKYIRASITSARQTRTRILVKSITRTCIYIIYILNITRNVRAISHIHVYRVGYGTVHLVFLC